MNKKLMTMAGLAVVFFIIVTVNVPAQQSMANYTSYGYYSSERDSFFLPFNLNAVNKNMLFLTYKNGAFAPGYNLSTVNMFNNNFFDIGTGLVLGDWRLGINFTHNIVGNYVRAIGRTVLSTFAGDGTVTNTITTEGGGGYTAGAPNNTLDGVSSQADTFRDLYRANINFGDKSWGIKNTFTYVISRNVSSTSPITWPATIGGVAIITPANNYIETNIAGGKNIVTYDVTGASATQAGNEWRNDVTFGLRLGEMIEALKPYTPWINLMVGIGQVDGGSFYGYERNYESKNVVGGAETVLASQKITYDSSAAYLRVNAQLVLSPTFTLNQYFNINPRLLYTPVLNIYPAKIGGEEGYVRTTAEIFHINVPSGTITNVDYTAADVGSRSGMAHTIAAHANFNGNFENFRFSIRWNPSFTVTNKSEEAKNIETTTSKINTGLPATSSETRVKTTTYGETKATSAVNYTNLFLVVGNVWVKPNVFRINFGASFSNTVRDITTTTITDGGIASTVETTVGSAAPTVVTNRRATTKKIKYVSGATSASAFDPSFRLGASWFLNDNVDFDFFIGQAAVGSVSIDALVPLNWGLQVNVKW